MESHDGSADDHSHSPATTAGPDVPAAPVIAQESQHADRANAKAAPDAAPGPASAPALALSAAEGPVIRQYELIERVLAYDPDADEDLLNRAYVFAMKAHGGQTRKNGDPYFSHPVAVAGILTELKVDPASIATALLHDVVEDTDISIEMIEASFGAEIARLVDGVTKISRRELAPDTDGKAENFAKFLLATANDVRVLLVKLADRLHNMRTLHHIDKPEKRERIARETMEVYAPMAARIGVARVREELEDLSFRYLNPTGYRAITDGLEKISLRAVQEVVALAQVLRSELLRAGLKAEVYSREKRAFSIWRKMQRKGSTFDELADIYAFRVLVDQTAECYRALGVIHQQFKMIPGEFDDYISVPKPNGYQSIHTAVLAPSVNGDGQRVEIQIRTKSMHVVAERGVAAHWRYKEQSRLSANGDSVDIGADGNYSTYEWLRGVIETLHVSGGNAAFLNQAKIDLYQDQIFPFTPKGRVIPLPKGATPLDFAYALHTQVGDRFAGAKINGVQRPARTQLKNGDVVEVLKAENAPIPMGWESYLVTGAARAGIRRRIRALKKQEQAALGQKILAAAFASRDLTWSARTMEEAAQRLGYASVPELYEAAGRMDVSGHKVVGIVYPQLGGPANVPAGPAIGIGADAPAQAISLEGVTTGGAVRLARCCRPLPGERIVGVRGKNRIVAHRIDCDRLERLQDEEWLNLAWTDEIATHFVAPIYVTVNNKTGALGHIGTMLARYGADIVDLRLHHREIDFYDLWFDIAVRDVRHLASVLAGLRASDYVVAADRRRPSGVTE